MWGIMYMYSVHVFMFGTPKGLIAFEAKPRALCIPGGVQNMSRIAVVNNRFDISLSLCLGCFLMEMGDNIKKTCTCICICINSLLQFTTYGFMYLHRESFSMLSNFPEMKRV